MEILNTLLTDEAKKSVIAAVNAAVQLRQEIDVHKEDIKAYAEDLKEKYDVKTAEFNAVVDAIHKNNIVEQKRKVLDLESVVDIVSGN